MISPKARSLFCREFFLDLFVDGALQLLVANDRLFGLLLALPNKLLSKFEECAGLSEDPKLNGHVQLDGLDITPDTTFDSIRSQLEKAGFAITEDQNVISAKKGEITIFTVETTNKIERIEAWCS